jgi:glycosyltransferase involved in cell wall biosynthesis
MADVLFSALAARRGGSFTYIRNIAASFPREPGHKLSILSPRPIEGLPAQDNIEWIRAPRWTGKPLLRFLLGAVYFRYIWARRNEFDLVYYAGGSFDIALPPQVRTAVAFRNMLPFDPESGRRYGWSWMRFRHWLLRHVQAAAFRRADLVIFISNFARRTIDAVVPDRRGRSVVVPHGVALGEMPLDQAIAVRLPARYVLYLSIIDVYKAQCELIEAWARVRQQQSVPEKLVLAGEEYPPYARRVREAVRRLGLEEDVVFLGAVHHDQILDLMRRATASVFLSACENCPNIMLELMQAGQPLLVSARQPMPELGGPELDYVDPYDVQAVADGLARLLGDPDYRARAGKAAAARAQSYSWSRTGKLTWDALLLCAGADARADPPNFSSSRRQASYVQR